MSTPTYSEDWGERTSTKIWNGEKADFAIFKSRQEQCAAARGYLTALTVDKMIVSAEEYESGQVKELNPDGSHRITAATDQTAAILHYTAITQDQKDNYTRNAKAVYKLACSLEDSMAHVVKHHRKAYDAWKYLCDTYYVKTADKDFETVTNLYDNCDPAQYKDPESYWHALEDAALQLKEIDVQYSKSKMEIMAHAAKHIKGEKWEAYKSKMRGQLSNITYEDYKLAHELEWNAIGNPNPNGTKTHGDFALSAFDGDCNYCKKYGHKETECRKRIYDQGRGPDRTHGNRGGGGPGGRGRGGRFGRGRGGRGGRGNLAHRKCFGCQERSHCCQLSQQRTTISCNVRRLCNVCRD